MYVTSIPNVDSPLCANFPIKDCEPFRFRGDENGWQLAGSLENKSGDGAGGPREESALNMFRQMDLKGQASVDTKLKSTHQNTINTVRAFEEANGQVRLISSKYSQGFNAML